MINFIKNYLLLILMGIGFVIVFGTILLMGQQSSHESLDSKTSSLSEMPMSDLTIEKLDGGVEKFKVAVVNTEETMKKGLMGLPTLPENQGMLFVFSDSQERGFWMKNTIIPLDMVFIDPDGTIHHIHPEAKPRDLETIRSNGPVQYVLELGGGITEKLGIEVGDKVIHADIH